MNNIISSAMIIAAAGIGAGRLIPTVAALVGLIGVVVGGLALARSVGRIGANLAVAAGLISVVVGTLHSVNAAGGFGTGNGLAGAIAAVVVGLVSMVLGGLGLIRSRTGHPVRGLDDDAE